MYAVAITNFGKLGECVPVGNNGLQKLHNKSLRGWFTETVTMRNTADYVFVIQDFTQKMCEMDNAQLVDHIRKNAVAQLK